MSFGHLREVVVPMVPFGPVGVPQAEADATYYREAAECIRWQAARGNAFAGSNLTETVARLCEAAADVLDPKPSNSEEADRG